MELSIPNNSLFSLMYKKEHEDRQKFPLEMVQENARKKHCQSVPLHAFLTLSYIPQSIPYCAGNLGDAAQDGILRVVHMYEEKLIK